MKTRIKICIVISFLIISSLVAGLSQAAHTGPSLLPNIYLPLTFNNFDSRVAQLGFIGTDPTHLDQSYIYSINENGSSPTNLTVNPANLMDFNWSPDGSKIAFSSDWGGDENIFTMNADGSDIVQLTFTTGYDFHPSWSSNGTKLVFISRRNGSNQVYVMGVDGSNVKQLTNLTLGCAMPLWSPVANKIAFINYGSESNEQEIYVVNVDGTGLQDLTNNAYYDSLEGWSPDGSKILFLSNRDHDGLPYAYDLYTMNSDGSNTQQLTTSGYVEAAEWSPDSTRIAYSEYTGPTGLSIIHPDGSDKTELLCESHIDSFLFSWSHNSSKIAFTPHSSTQETQGVYIVRADNSSCAHISNLLASGPKWRPMP